MEEAGQGLEGRAGMLRWTQIEPMDLLLYLQVLAGLTALLLSWKVAAELQGPATYWFLGSVLASFLALVLRADQRIKRVLSIAPSIGAGLLVTYRTGINGASLAYLQVGLVLSVLWLSAPWRRSVVLFTTAVVFGIATASLTGIIKVGYLDATNIRTWRFMIPLCASCYTLVLAALSKTLEAAESQSQTLASRYEEFLSRRAERVEAQSRLTRANQSLRAEVERQTRRLEDLRSEFELLSDQLIGGLRPTVDALKVKVDELSATLGRGISSDAAMLLRRLATRTESAGTLLEDLSSLGIADAGRLHLQEVDVSALADVVLQEIRERSGSDVKCSIDPGIRVIADAGLVRSVLRNLMENAWKFSSSNPLPEMRVTGIERNGQKGVLVSDNGPGFERDVRDRIFESFVRGSSASAVSGSGIGLYTVKRIAERHKGEVLLESPGLGSFQSESGASVGVTFGLPLMRESELSLQADWAPVDLRLPPLEKWRADTLQILLVAQSFSIVPLVAVYSPLLWRSDSRFTLLLWLICGVLILATWKRDWPHQLRALVGLAPAVSLAVVLWFRTTYFTAPVGVSVLAICLALLLYGKRVMAVIAMVVLGAATAGYVQVMRGTFNALHFTTRLEYWALQTALAAAPLALLLLTLNQAIDRLRAGQAGALSVAGRLEQEVAERDRLVEDAQRLGAKLDEEIAARSTELLATIESLSSFSYIVSHDLRGPVRSISGLVQILQEDHGMELSTSARETLREIKRLNVDLSSLIERLIGLAQILKATPEFRPIDILEEVRQRLPANLQIDLETHMTALVDPKLLRQGLGILAAHLEGLPRVEVTTSTPPVVSFSGVSPDFLEAVTRAEIPTQVQDGIYHPIAIDAVALVRIFKRIGLKLWVETGGLRLSMR